MIALHHDDLGPEDHARAELYGLLAALLYAPPDATTLEALRHSAALPDAPDTALTQAWGAWLQQVRTCSAEAVADEYTALFGGVGKPEVYLYGSHYLSGFLNEKPLARLRHDLAALGLSRDERVHETEDHLAFLCEVMRYLIAGADAPVERLASQRDFFRQHLQPWATRACQAMQSHPQAHWYAALAVLADAFFAIEAQGFDLLD